MFSHEVVDVVHRWQVGHVVTGFGVVFGQVVEVLGELGGVDQLDVLDAAFDEVTIFGVVERVRRGDLAVSHPRGQFSVLAGSVTGHQVEDEAARGLAVVDEPAVSDFPEPLEHVVDVDCFFLVAVSHGGNPPLWIRWGHWERSGGRAS